MNATRIEYESTEEDYDSLLNDCYPAIVIGSCTFYASEILKECDPTAYRCGKVDYESEAGLDTWKCGECETEYDNEDEADECCQPEEDD